MAALPGELVVRIRPGNETKHITNPDALARRSVVLREAIEKAQDGEPVIITTYEPRTSRDAVDFVLDSLQRGRADRGYLKCDATKSSSASGSQSQAASVMASQTSTEVEEIQIITLAKVCNFLVEYQCDTRLFEEFWREVDPRSPSSSHDQDRQSNTSSNDTVRCWRAIVPRKKAGTAGLLAVSALVLGQQKALERELGIAVWALDIKLNTSIPDLQNLEAMRHQELEAIFELLKKEHHKLCGDHAELAKEISDAVERNGLGKLTCETWEDNCAGHATLDLKSLNPYKLIRRYEDAIKPKMGQARAAPVRPPSIRREIDPRAPQPFSFRALGHVVYEAVEHSVHNLVARNGTADNNAAKKDEIFDLLESLVKYRQREWARTLMERRNSMVNGWLRELGLLQGRWPPDPSRRPSPKGKGKSIDRSWPQTQPVDAESSRNGEQTLVEDPPPRPRHQPGYRAPYPNGFRRGDLGPGTESSRNGNGRSVEQPQRPRPPAHDWGQWVDNHGAGETRSEYYTNGMGDFKPILERFGYKAEAVQNDQRLDGWG